MNKIISFFFKIVDYPPCLTYSNSLIVNEVERRNNICIYIISSISRSKSGISVCLLLDGSRPSHGYPLISKQIQYLIYTRLIIKIRAYPTRSPSPSPPLSPIAIVFFIFYHVYIYVYIYIHTHTPSLSCCCIA